VWSPNACYLRNSVTFFGPLKKCRLQNCSPSAFHTDSSPLQVRISLRDSFDPPTAPVQVSLTRLNSVVGYDFSLVIPWVDIHRDLASSFPDISILVPSVGNALTAYLNRIVTLLDDEKFQEAFLEKMSNLSNRNIVVLVGEQTNEDKSFFDKHGKLTFSLPRTGPQWFRQMSSRVGHDIEALFLTGGTTSSPAPAIVTSMQKVSIADWVDVPSSTSQRVPAVTSLPLLNTLSKPESLFSSLLPYFIVVTNSGASIHIQGSHQPTIDLVHGYFQMHTRKNMNLTTQVRH
jgi:hypothetical protein